MNIKRVLLYVTVIAGMLAFAARADTKHFRVTLRDGGTIGTQELQAGEYKVEVDEANAKKVTFTNAQSGKSIEVNANIETVERKYANTAVHYGNAGGARQITQINLGGTNMKIAFE